MSKIFEQVIPMIRNAMSKHNLLPYGKPIEDGDGIIAPFGNGTIIGNKRPIVVFAISRLEIQQNDAAALGDLIKSRAATSAGAFNAEIKAATEAGLKQ